MDKGYSNLLTEILPAVDIDYEDTADLQIVCPACREPIYKAVRKSIPAVHYLAHYEASRSAVAECELRVGSMGEATIISQNQDAREQRSCNQCDALTYNNTCRSNMISIERNSSHPARGRRTVKRPKRHAANAEWVSSQDEGMPRRRHEARKREIPGAARSIRQPA